MKKLALFAAAFCLFMSCNKKDIDIAPNATFEFTTLSISGPTSGMTEGTGIKLFSYKFESKGMPEGGIDVIQFKIDGTVPVSKLKNFQVVIKDEDSVVILDEKIGNSPTYVVSTTEPSISFSPDALLIDDSREYSLTIFSDASAGTFGKLTVSAKILYSWWNGNDFSLGETEFKSGPMFNFGYKIAPVVTSPAPVNTMVANGDDIGTVMTIGANNGPIAVKSVTYRVLFADNGVNNTISVDSLRVFFGSQDITSSVTISDSLGVPVTVLSETNASHRKVNVTITGGTINGELVIGQSESEDLKFIGRVQGLGSTADADGVSIVPINDNALPPTGAGHVVRGSGSDTRARLATSANGAGTLYNFVWSNLTSIPHSAIFGLSSNDWKNGFGVTFTVTTNIYHSRNR
jgi:hypothetical protein